MAEWEEKLYQDKEILETYAVILEEKASKALTADSDRVFHHWRGEVRRDIEKLEELYQNCRELDALARTLEITSEEERDGEVRLEKEKYFAQGTENEYSGTVGKANESHMERQEEARNSDILRHGDTTNCLRSTLHNYERLLYEINNRFEEIDVETPFTPQEHDAEIIEESPEAQNNSLEDVAEQFFSKTI